MNSLYESPDIFEVCIGSIGILMSSNYGNPGEAGGEIKDNNYEW